MNKRIIDKLKKFNLLIQNTLSVKSQVILFGSYVKGTNKKWSDIDVAIILPEVKDRLKLEVDLRVKAIQIDERINPFIFSYDELKENSPLIWEIKRYGKKIQ